MAGALQCDRCKKFFTRSCVPDLRVNHYRHPYGDTWYDLCNECTKDLERFLRNKTVETRKEN